MTDTPIKETQLSKESPPNNYKFNSVQSKRRPLNLGTLLGLILTLTITGGGILVAWGYNKADIAHLKQECVRLEKQIENNQASVADVKEGVAKDKAAQAKIETKIDNIEAAITDIKSAQQKILDLLINRNH